MRPVASTWCRSVPLLVLLLSVAAFADEARVRYDNHQLVQVTLRTPAELEEMLAISPDHWSCAVGLGTVPFRVPPERLDELDASGLPYVVVHENIQALLDAEQAAMAQAQRGGVWFDTYHTYADVNAYLDALAALRPELAATLNLGVSLELRAIRGIRVTGTNGVAGKPAVLFNGCQHAREWVSVMVPMYIADRLIRDYGVDPEITTLLDAAVVYVVPIVNPDGYEYTWSTDRLWRKNRRNNGGGSFGVDTNRNWGVGWGGAGSSSNPDSETYRGTAAFSEPETQRLRDFMLAHPELRTYIDFHSYSQLVLSPYGYFEGEPAEPDGSTFRDLDGRMAQAILDVHGETYIAGPIGTTLYLAAGNAVDWGYDAAGAFSFTIELRPDTDNPGFILPPEEIRPTAEENFAAAKVLIEYAGLLLVFEFPNGLPDVVPAGATSDVAVRIRELSGTLLPGSPRLFHRIGTSGAFTESPLTPLGGSDYLATLPAGPCGETIEYYFQAQTTNGQTVRYPSQGELSAAVTVTQVVFEDDMEVDRGWTVGAPGDNATTGIWNRMNPQGTAAQPEDDHTPAGTLCWVTDGLAGASIGERDVDNGHTTLRSPMIDLSDAPEGRVGYWRWYSNNQGGAPNADVFVVDVSNDGMNWVNVETVGPSGPETSGGWFYHEFRVADFVAPAATVRLRFIAEDAGGGSIVEAAVDDVRVVSTGCPPTCPGDFDGDGVIGLGDLAVLLANYGVSQPSGGDVDGDGDVDLEDLSTLLSLYGTSCP